MNRHQRRAHEAMIRKMRSTRPASASVSTNASLNIDYAIQGILRERAPIRFAIMDKFKWHWLISLFNFKVSAGNAGEYSVSLGVVASAHSTSHMEQVVKSALATQIEREIRQYLSGVVNIGQNYDFSAAKLVRRISLFENHIYPSGKFDAQGNYKFWFDIITPRIMAEVKNIDFDTKDIQVYSDRKIDDLAVLIVNLELTQWLRENGQAEEINEAIEESSGWGNIVWKKVKGSYERVDLKNFYVINQTAEDLDQSAAIERHELTQADLREKIGVWNYVQETIDQCSSDTRADTIESQAKETTTPVYEIFERNGEVKLSELNEFIRKPVNEGDDKKYVLAKVVAAGVKGGSGSIDIKYILFAQELKGEMCDIYKEYHRTPYKGRWLREGIIELLFDLQVRANQIGNQLAQGLEWASKTIFSTDDKTLVQNMLTDLSNGDIIRAKNLTQVDVTLKGFAELVQDWNRIIQLADAVSNSNSIVQGERLPFGTSFRLAALLNQNANKTFDFIRQKLAIPMTEIFEDWIIPDLIKDLKQQEVLRITGDADMLGRLYQLVVDDWYLKNLVALGPHSQEAADMMKAEKYKELQKRPHLLMTGLAQAFDGFKPAVSIVITGENSRVPEELDSLAKFIPLVQDPVRRDAMIELAMRKNHIDVASLPKSPQQLAPAAPPPGLPAEQDTPPNSPGPMPHGAHLPPPQETIAAANH